MFSMNTEAMSVILKILPSFMCLNFVFWGMILVIYFAQSYGSKFVDLILTLTGQRVKLSQRLSSRWAAMIQGRVSRGRRDESNNISIDILHEQVLVDGSDLGVSPHGSAALV